MTLTDLSPAPDAETKAERALAGNRAEMRLWLRLLACTDLIEGEMRRRLRDEFDFMPPRFDVQIVRMTDEGRRKFRRVAASHGDWVASFFESLPREGVDRLMGRLGGPKSSVRKERIKA